MIVRAPLLATDPELVRSIADQFDTPVVLYSAKLLRDRLEALTAALPAPARLVYSVKANPNPALLQFFAQHGLYFETASAGEFLHVRQAGIPAQHVLFGGLVKRPEGVSVALRDGVLAFNVESLSDLMRVGACASDLSVTAPIILRVNPRLASSQAVLRMGGAASQFGIDEEYIPSMITNCSKDTKYCGLFMYAGSQYFDANEIIYNTRHLCRLARHLVDTGFPSPSMLDFGGGFGVPEDDSQPDLDLGLLRQGLNAVFKEDLMPLVHSGLEYAFFESGRFLVATSAALITRVVDIKESRGQRFIITDGGINNLGVKQLMYRSFEPTVHQIWPRRNGGGQPAVIVGPTCTPIDVIHKGAELPDVAVGDLLGIGNCGAYLLSYSPVNFCGHPIPAEVMIYEGGLVRMIRKRGSFEEACGYGFDEWRPEHLEENGS